MATRSAVVVPFLLLLAVSSGAQSLYSLRTKDLDLVYYDKAHEYLSYHLARSFENSLSFDERLFHYTPSEPVVVLMQDFGDFGHGGTSTVPWNYISIGIEPFDYVYDTMPANERMNWLMHHELVHVVATDKGADSDLFYRRLFHGKVAPIKENPMSMAYSYLTSPRWYSPRWFHEGIAAFLETWMAGGAGRALGGYDEMVFRTMVRDHAYFYDVVGLESEGTTVDFQIGQNSYLYGLRFVSYIAMKYGPEKLIQWFDRSPGSKRYFSAQFREVFGVSLDEEWRRWIQWEHEWQSANLALVRHDAVTKETPLIKDVLGSVSRSFYDPDRKLLYAAINRPAKPAQIAAINVENGTITPLTDIKSPALYFVTSMAYDAKERTIFFTTNNSRGWRDLNALDLANGRTRQLLKNTRTGDLAVNAADHSVWGVQHHNGLSTVVRIPKPYARWEPLFTLEYGRDLYDLDVSPDGRILSASMIDVTGRQQLVKFDTAELLQHRAKPEVLHEFENNSPANFVFSPDGRYLYGTSYYTGVSNVFRYDLQSRKMAALTNVETGLFRPIPLSDHDLIAYQYTAKGFSPVRLPSEPREDITAIRYLGQQVVEKHPVVKSWNAGSPARVNLDQVTTYTGPYRPFSRLRLGSVYPVIEGYKNTATAGLRFNVSDPLGLRAFDLTAAVSPGHVKSDERLHFKLGYDGSPWRVRLRYNATDFYDLFGPTKTSRKGYSAFTSYHQFLLFDRPRTLEYTLHAAYYGGLETLPEYQNVLAPYRQYQTVGGHLDYHDVRRTIGAVEEEYGHSWTAAASGNHVNGKLFPRLYATYDHGFLLPIDHTSLWFRSAAGKSSGDRTNPFANYYFGAFGNNWVDYQDIHRYREYYAFPGFDLNEIGGSDFAKLMVECTLPPMRFKRVGVPALYANWARLALFAGGLTTNISHRSLRQKVYDAGAQIDVSLVMFSNLESMLSFGYARGRSEGKSSHEIMASLKLLR